VSCLGKRERSLNQLVLVYYVTALSLFRRLNLAAVLAHLVSGLRWLWPNPSLRLPTAAALVYRRRQLGGPIMRHLFQRVCRPMATEQTTGAFRFGLRLMAIDGTLDEVADTSANALYFGRLSSGKHQSPFPQVRCVYLAEVGTHAIVDAVFVPCRVVEQRLVPMVLSRSVQAGMLVLMDRGIVLAPRVEHAGPSAGSGPGAPQGQPVHPCRAGALRWQLFGHPASDGAAGCTGACDRVSHRAAHRRTPGAVSVLPDE
jgi:Insertion element 4 transposase N-terminal